MPKAVSCWFDSVTEAKIRDLWREIAAHGYDATMSEGPYRPHVTLGVCGDLHLNAFSVDLRKLVSNMNEIPFSLSSVGMFPNDPPVIFLAVTQTGRIRELHSQVQALMTTHGSDPVPYYLPECWVPHCTLAPWIDRLKVAGLVDWLAELQLPIYGRIERIGIIETPEEVELEEILLGGK